MKEIIDVEIKVRKVDIEKCETDMLAVGIFSDAKKLDKLCGQLNSKLDGGIQKLIDLGDFKGKEGSSSIVYGNDLIGAKRIMLVGLGDKKKATIDTLRKAAASSANKAVAAKIENLSLALHIAFGAKFDDAVAGRVCGEGVYFGSYRYDEFVTEKEDENGRLKKLNVEIVDPDSSKTRKLNKGLADGVVVGKAQSFARTLSNRPGNIVNPAVLANEAKKLARSVKNLSCTVFDEKQLKEKGMGGILAVGSGSANKPRFIVLKYTPTGAKAKRLPTVGLVGKAITIDSGGLSLKPAANMDQMKLDKSGGITVLGTMKAISQLKLPVNVYGIIPSAENMPGAASYRPGDIVTTFSGKTVEVQNTDAEGRMILCDGISYADKQGCGIIVDVATLTGACMVALGKYMAGLMGSDQALIKKLQQAAEQSGEKLWPMPSGAEYLKEMKSKIADLKNIGSRWGGACTAAAFLGQFAGERKWAHLDIAGMDLFDKASEYSAEGSSGFGVRLLTTYIINLAKGK